MRSFVGPCREGTAPMNGVDYGQAIVPARIKNPRDKRVVEGSVRFVANQVAAVLRDRCFIGCSRCAQRVGCPTTAGGSAAPRMLMTAL